MKRIAIALGLLITAVFFPVAAQAQRNADVIASQNIVVPPFDSIKKVSEKSEITAQDASSRTYTLVTREHKPIGDAYIIITDQTDEQYLQPLKKLANFHNGKIIRVENLADLPSQPAARAALRNKLLAEKPKYVALAPTLHSYQENVLLSFWQILDGLGPEPGLDAFPSVLLAPDAVSFSGLIDRSISYKPTRPKPFIVSQITDCGATHRSLQKLRILRRYFENNAIESKGLLVRAFKSIPCKDTLVAEPGEFEVTQEKRGVLVQAVGPQAHDAITSSNLLIMFGHGVPGMTCSLNVDALADIDLKNKIVLSGSCYSAAALYPDLDVESVGEDGSAVDQSKERVFQRALSNGAVVFLGHMRANGGFPAISTFFMGLADGLSVGESYQRLTNAHLGISELPAGRIVIQPDRINDPQALRRHLDLLYLVIGDPALCPYPGGIGKK